MKHFNICPICIHQSYCALTTQKDKVWSCSEFDAIEPSDSIIKSKPQIEKKLELI